MSGTKLSDGYRVRRSQGVRRRLSQENLAEIRRAIAIENSQARRAGRVPQGAKVTMFSCPCNCFSIKVD